MENVHTTPAESKWNTHIRLYLEKQLELCEADWRGKSIPAPGTKPMCDCIPNTLTGPVAVNFAHVPLNITLANNTDVHLGGHWEPAQCIPRYKVVVIVPFRDRKQHLSVLLRYMHPLLQTQQANYTLVVVEQNGTGQFNKAVLMNIGYRYAMAEHRPDCVIFHDVDFIPEDGRHLYRCRMAPIHLGAFHDRWRYEIKREKAFGGVTAFAPKTFERLNGFSNRFFGWGGEDDDMWHRMLEKEVSYEHNPKEVARYKVIRHKRDKLNVQRNRKKMLMVLLKDRRPDSDGLNTLRYRVMATRLYPLYTHLLINVKDCIMAKVLSRN